MLHCGCSAFTSSRVSQVCTFTIFMDLRRQVAPQKQHGSIQIVVLAALKVGLRGACLIKLDPLESFSKRSSLVLLHGSLRATHHSDKDPSSFPEKLAPNLTQKPPGQSAQARLSSLFSIEGSPPDKPSVIQEETDDPSQPVDSCEPGRQSAESTESHVPGDESLRARGRRWLESCSSQQRQGRRAVSTSSSSSGPGPLQQHLAPCVLPWLWDFALDR